MGPLVGVTGLPNTGTASLGTNRNTQSGYLLQSWSPVRSYLSSCSLCGRGPAIETIVQNTLDKDSPKYHVRFTVFMRVSLNLGFEFRFYFEW